VRSLTENKEQEKSRLLNNCHHLAPLGHQLMEAVDVVYMGV
jgi:hypothetical protein